MSNEESNNPKIPNVIPPNKDIGKVVNKDKLFSEKPLVEGYQPTDKLNTSNPPSNQGKDETK